MIFIFNINSVSELSDAIGTSDEHLALLEHLSPLQSKLSALIVTTPQAIALLDVMKCVSFTRAVSLPVLGLIENMSGFVCPCCGEINNLFSTGGGQALAEREGLMFLGALPIDTELVSLLDGDVVDLAGGEQEVVHFPLLFKYKQTASFSTIHGISSSIINRLSTSDIKG